VEVDVAVAIIGAGPAGSTLAALLASRGIDVALIDRDLFPRDKLCGEFLSYDALPILDLLGAGEVIAQRGAAEIRVCRVLSAGGKRDLTFELPHAARGISRLLLDETLFRTALAKGAQGYDGWTATALQADRVTISRGEEKRELRAKVVAGAWGRWGRFDALLGRPFVRDRAHRHFGFKRHYHASGTAATSIDLLSFRGGYLGVSPVEGGLINICGLVHADRLAGHRGRWDGFVDALRAEAPHLERLFAAHTPAQKEFLSSEPVIFRGKSPVVDGVVMVGDAAGIIDPLAGNGMAMGLQSALLAALTIERILGGADRVSSLQAYAEGHRQHFASRIRWSRLIGRLLSKPRLLEAGLAFGSAGMGRALTARTRGSVGEVERLVEEWDTQQGRR
jgi:flavin-dependent dehydrogenase